MRNEIFSADIQTVKMSSFFIFYLA